MMKQPAVAVLLAIVVAETVAWAGAQSLRTPRAEAQVEQRGQAQPTTHPIVAITFDDLPQVGVLPVGEDAVSVATKLVSELKANHLEGTYGFVNADKLPSRPGAPQALQIWIDAGMNIGNHTFSHSSLTTNTAEAFEQDIAK